MSSGSVASLGLLGDQAPRVCSVPEFVSSTGPEAVELCAMAGLLLDPGQQFVLDRSLGERANGRWAAFEVGLMESRQNGKGAILEAREMAGLFLLGERLIIHSAHEFATATEARLRMETLLEGAPDLSRRVRSINRSHGSEGFTLRSGQRLIYRTRTKGGGRGFSCDCLMLDEAMVISEAFIGALLPTLSAKSMSGDPQVWYTGSAVDQSVHADGIVFSRIRARGHAGGDPSLAYFEWSLDEANPEDVTPAVAQDERAWAQANPGLGIRISAEHVAHEQRSMGAREFAVERLGVGDWPSLDGAQSVISLEQWNRLADPGSQPQDPVCFAFDVAPDRSWASISAAGRRADGRSHVEVVERRRGTGWVTGKLVDLVAKHEPLAVVCDAAGPAGSLLHELQQEGVQVHLVTASEHAKACGLFFDAVDQKSLRHRAEPVLDAAVKGAVSRPLGEAWAWSRRTSAVDISPLVACTLAHWGLATMNDAAWVGW